MTITAHSRWPAKAVQEAPAWDPLTTPYLSAACRSARHRECTRGMDFYPQGLAGERIRIPCACSDDRCPCAGKR